MSEKMYPYPKKMYPTKEDILFNIEEGIISKKVGEELLKRIEEETTRHGKWIPADPDTRGCTLRFACSVCGNYTTYYEDAHDCDYDYCPNCGAKMDLED